MRKEKILALFISTFLIIGFFSVLPKIQTIRGQASCVRGCTVVPCGSGCYETESDCGSGSHKCREIDTGDDGGGGGGGGGGGANGAATNLKCNCTAEFGACGDKFGKTDIQWRQCQFNVNGAQTCNWHVGPTLYQWKTCEAGPTVTPGGPTLTPTPTGTTPTPTDNPNCGCLQVTKTCRGLQNANACSFEKFSDITTYQNPIKCGLADNLFQSAPSAENKKDWCQAEKRTKGDSDGNGTVNYLDYFYFVSAKAGAKIPPTVNPDFNGDNQINDEDRAIIIKSLK